MERKSKADRALGTWALLLMITAAMGFGCATMQPEKPKTLTATDWGTVLFLDKYEFKSPPQDWALMKNLEGGDFELGFMKMERGEFPSQTTFMYDDQPYGSSQDLEKRAQYYCTRFLFNSGIDLRVTKKENLILDGREAIVLNMEGENLSRNEKAKSIVYLVKKGNWVVSFVCTQWRPMNAAYSQEPFNDFEAFVRSFKFLKKDFYENFEDELNKAGL